METNTFIKTVIAILGKPNVGKSSLLNAIMNKKLSSVNKKPQTTRNKMNYAYYQDDNLIEFIDTPGFHEPQNKLDEFLNKQVKNVFQESNLIFFLTDISRSLNDEDLQLLKLIKKAGLPIFVVVTKIDLLENNKQIETRINQLKEYIDIEQFFCVSTLENNMSNLLDETIKFNRNNNFLVFNIDNEISDNFLISEIIRETCLETLKDEVPYGVQVNIDNKEYSHENNMFKIEASIVVEKDSHKPIVLGKGGSMIKEIGTISRQKLLSVFDTKIFLKLFVKVDKDWRNNLVKIKEFGYYN